MKTEIYVSEPAVDNPLLDRISKAAIIAWFRCNSCLSCKFREEAIDPDPAKDIRWCSNTHNRHDIIDMVKFLGYSKE